jgi:hypothetical protein
MVGAIEYGRGSFHLIVSFNPGIWRGRKAHPLASTPAETRSRDLQKISVNNYLCAVFLSIKCK